MAHEWWGYWDCIYPSFVYISLKEFGVVGLDMYTWGIKDFHKCWSGSLAKRRLCLGPAGVINCTPLSALSFWVTLFPRTRGYNSSTPRADPWFGLPDTATHSSILAWRIPWMEDPGGLQSMGLQRVGHYWSDWACTPARYRWFLTPKGWVRWHRVVFLKLKLDQRDPWTII